MVLKRVGLPVLVVIVTVVFTLVAYSWPSDQVAVAAPVRHVTLSEPLQLPLSITGIAPGDSGSAGAFRIRYDGNVPAWLGLDTDLLGPLADGDYPLAITISDTNLRYRTRGMNQVVGFFEPGQQFILSVTYSFPRQAGNGYQAKNASLILQVHAVEADENTHYENGRATGPITWQGRLESASLTGAPVAPPAPTEGTPCVGEGCAPTVTEQLGTQVTTGLIPSVAAVASTGAACCDCIRSLFWWWLSFLILLILAMLAAFYLGWRLRERSYRRRVRIRHRPSPLPPTDPSRGTSS